MFVLSLLFIFGCSTFSFAIESDLKNIADTKFVDVTAVGGFLSYSKLNGVFSDFLNKTYGCLSKSMVIGRSAGGLEITAYRLGVGEHSNWRPTVVVFALMDGRDIDSVSLALYTALYLCSEASLGNAGAALRQSYVWIIPALNADAYHHNTNGNTNLSNATEVQWTNSRIACTSFNAPNQGVKLWRNFGEQWSPSTGGCSEQFGDSAMSEPEMKAVSKLMNSLEISEDNPNQEHRAAALHLRYARPESSRMGLGRPFCYDGDAPVSTGARIKFNTLAAHIQAMGTFVSFDTCGRLLLLPSSGELLDWLWLVHGVYALDVRLKHSESGTWDSALASLSRVEANAGLAHRAALWAVQNFELDVAQGSQNAIGTAIKELVAALRPYSTIDNVMPAITLSLGLTCCFCVCFWIAIVRCLSSKYDISSGTFTAKSGRGAKLAQFVKNRARQARTKLSSRQQQRRRQGVARVPLESIRWIEKIEKGSKRT